MKEIMKLTPEIVKAVCVGKPIQYRVVGQEWRTYSSDFDMAKIMMDMASCNSISFEYRVKPEKKYVFIRIYVDDVGDLQVVKRGIVPLGITRWVGKEIALEVEV